MKRLFILMIFLLALLPAACSSDPCWSGPNTPSCETSKAQSQATITALDGAIRAQTTRDANDARATDVAVKAQATAQAIRNDATRVSVSAEATRIALDTDTAIKQSQVQNAVALPREIILTVGLTLVMAGAVLAVLVYGRRTLNGTARALARSSGKKTAIVRYGPPENPQVALVTFDGQNFPTRIFTTENMIDCNNDLLSDTTSFWKQLQVPDEMKLALMAESQKRLQAARMAVGTGVPPWGGRSVEVIEPPPMPLASASPASDLAVPSFADLLQRWTPTRDQMLLGVSSDGSPRYCSLDNLLSTGVIGRPGMGKSTTLRFHYLQCRLVGARVVVWDLHRTIVKTLPGAEAFTKLEQIDQSAEEMCALLDHRLRHDLYDDRPVMILADEFNLLGPSSQTATEAIGRIILEGRKVSIFAMVSGQGFPAHLFGDSTPRDALSSRFVLHTTTRQASMVGLDKDALPWVISLKRGYAVVDGPIDPQILAIPNTTEADIKAFLPGSDSFGEPVPPVPAGAWEPADAQDGTGYGTGPEPARELGEMAETVRDLLRKQTPIKEIIRQIWGDAATTGNAYRVHSEKLRAIMAQLV